MNKVGTFDILKVMCERNMDVRLSTLHNVRGAKLVKKNSWVEIGFSGDIVTGLALGNFVGGLLIADKDQFNQVKRELEVEARADIAEIWVALEESLKLQRHYAELLNHHDGGERLLFDSVEAWLKRLRTLRDKPSAEVNG